MDFPVIDIHTAVSPCKFTRFELRLTYGLARVDKESTVKTSSISLKDRLEAKIFEEALCKMSDATSSL